MVKIFRIGNDTFWYRGNTLLYEKYMMMDFNSKKKLIPVMGCPGI